MTQYHIILVPFQGSFWKVWLLLMSVLYERTSTYSLTQFVHCHASVIVNHGQSIQLRAHLFTSSIIWILWFFTLAFLWFRRWRFCCKHWFQSWHLSFLWFWAGYLKFRGTGKESCNATNMYTCMWSKCSHDRKMDETTDRWMDRKENLMVGWKKKIHK